MGRKKREDINMGKKLFTALLLLGSFCSSSAELKLVDRHSGLRLATRAEVQQEFQAVMAQMGKWHIAVFEDGRLLGAGYGGNIVDLDPNSGAGHEIAVLGEIQNTHTPSRGRLFSKDNFTTDSITNTYSRFDMEARPGYRVHLTFLSFSSNPSERCDEDRVFVIDTNGDRIHQYCGNSEKPESIFSRGNKLSFELDSFKPSSQFLAIWEEVNTNFEQQTEGNHLISFPHTLIENSDEQVCVDLFSARDERGSGSVALKVFTKEDLVSGRIGPTYEDTLSFSTNENKKCKSINISSNTTKAFLNFKASFETPNYGFNVFKEIQVLPKETYNLIQTDKGQYKPNDTVKFRILLLDDSLKPAQISNIDEIWVEDSNSNRIQQWRNKPLNNGMLQQEFTLLDEPALGAWSINFKTADLEEKTSFKVAEYILPKYEVKIEPRSTILRNSKDVAWNVCGTYTHGGSVKGLVRWNVTLGVKIQPINSSSTSVGNGQACAVIELNSFDLQYSSYLGNYLGNSISLEVEFEEEGTQTKIVKSWMGSVMNEEIKVSGDSCPRKFSVGGFPYIGRFRTTHHDGTPVVDTLLNVCWQTNGIRIKTCQNGNTDQNGNFKFYIPSSNIPTGAQTMTIFAKALNFTMNRSTGMEQPLARVDVEVDRVKSRKSIMIENQSHGKIQCNEQFEAVVYIASPEREAFDLHYYIISKGKLYAAGKVVVNPDQDGEISEDDLTNGAQRVNNSNDPPVDMFIRKKIINIEIDHNVSPTMTLVVFSNEDENVTVTDSKLFKVDSCQNHDVRFDWSQVKVNPGSPVNIEITAESSSLCGISVTDKSVDLLGNSNDITREKIGKLLEDIGQRKMPSNEQRCNTLSKMLQSSGISILSDLSQFQTCHTFKDALNMTDEVDEMPEVVSNRGKCRRGWSWNVYRRRCVRNRNSRRRYEEESTGFSLAINERGRPEIQDYVVEDDYSGEDEVAYAGGAESAFSMVQHAVIPNRNYNRVSNKGTAFSSSLPDFKISDFSEKKAKVEKPKIELRNYFPETWLFQLNDTDNNGKLNISTNSPHTMTEWQGEAFCINNQQGLGVAKPKALSVDQDFFAEINLPYSIKRGETVSLNISVFNKIQSQLPVYVQINADPNSIYYQNNHEEVCVESGDSVVVPFKIEALDIGKQNITASASITRGIPGCNNVAEGKGFTDALVRPLLVKPEGIPEEKVRTKLECSGVHSFSNFSMPKMFLPGNFVKGSARGWVQISSDVMAPALQNIEKLVNLPTGCGEQNMIGLVPNIYLLQYLDATNKREPELREKAKTFMKIGYNRQQAYRHEDGSFSIWGTSKHNAHFRRGVDEGSTWLTAFVVKSFTMAAKYIDVDRRLLQQSVEWLMEGQMENGCFSKSGYVHHKELAGASSNASLTPFVFTALLEARSRLEVDLNQARLLKAMDCMLDNVNTSDAYTSVLTAYAANRLVLLGEQFNINEKMKERISLLWPYVIEMNPGTSRKIPASIFQKSMNIPKTDAVEMTAYNLMTLLTQGKTEEATRVVKWLAGQRNSQGGFISTQDTVIALQALSMYALKVPSNTLDMSVKITENNPRRPNKKSIDTSFNLTQDNAQLLQSKKLIQFPNKISVEMTGKGCVMVQTILRYNVQEKRKDKGFKLAVYNQNDETIRVCAQYTGTKEQTNMVVAEIEMVTGWEAYRESVEELLNDVESRVRKYEMKEKENKVVLYFDDIPKDEHCIEMEVKLVTLVEETKHAVATVYDYYDVDETKSIKYLM